MSLANMIITNMIIINQFRDERNGRLKHNEKNLAIPNSIEATELLEDFQWFSAEEAVQKNLSNSKEEIADVLIYALMLTDNLALDVEQLIEEKLEKSARKYPVTKRACS